MDISFIQLSENVKRCGSTCYKYLVNCQSSVLIEYQQKAEFCRQICINYL